MAGSTCWLISPRPRSHHEAQRAAFKQARRLRQSANIHEKFEKNGIVDTEGFVTASRKHNDVKRKGNYKDMTWVHFRRLLLSIGEPPRTALRCWDACTDELGNKLREVEVDGDKALRVPMADSGGSESHRGREIGEVHTGALLKGVVADDATEEEGEEEGEEEDPFGDGPEGQDDEGEESEDVGSKGGDASDCEESEGEEKEEAAGESRRGRGRGRGRLPARGPSSQKAPSRTVGEPPSAPRGGTRTSRPPLRRGGGGPRAAARGGGQSRALPRRRRVARARQPVPPARGPLPRGRPRSLRGRRGAAGSARTPRPRRMTSTLSSTRCPRLQRSSQRAWTCGRR